MEKKIERQTIEAYSAAGALANKFYKVIEQEKPTYQAACLAFILGTADTITESVKDGTIDKAQLPEFLDKTFDYIKTCVYTDLEELKENDVYSKL